MALSGPGYDSYSWWGQQGSTDGPRLHQAGRSVLFGPCSVLKIDFLSESHFWLFLKNGKTWWHQTSVCTCHHRAGTEQQLPVWIQAVPQPPPRPATPHSAWVSYSLSQELLATQNQNLPFNKICRGLLCSKSGRSPGLKQSLHPWLMRNHQDTCEKSTSQAAPQNLSSCRAGTWEHTHFNSTPGHSVAQIS